MAEALPLDVLLTEVPSAGWDGLPVLVVVDDDAVGGPAAPVVVADPEEALFGDAPSELAAVGS